MKITLIAGARPNFMDISYRPGPEKTDGRGVEKRRHSGEVVWDGGGADCGEIIEGLKYISYDSDEL